MGSIYFSEKEVDELSYNRYMLPVYNQEVFRECYNHSGSKINDKKIENVYEEILKEKRENAEGLLSNRKMGKRWNWCVLKFPVEIEKKTETGITLSKILTNLGYLWIKIFKNGPNKVCGRQPLKIWIDVICLGRLYHFKFFKGCLPQILLGPFLNTLKPFNNEVSSNLKSWTLP